MRARALALVVLGPLLAATPAAGGDAPGQQTGPGSDGPAERAPGVRCRGLGASSLREAAGNLAVARARTGRAARSEARRTCRAAVEALVLPDGSTVGAASARQPALAEAVEAAVRRAVREADVRLLADGGTALEAEVELRGPLAGARPGAGSGGAP